MIKLSNVEFSVSKTINFNTKIKSVTLREVYDEDADITYLNVICVNLPFGKTYHPHIYKNNIANFVKLIEKFVETTAHNKHMRDMTNRLENRVRHLLTVDNQLDDDLRLCWIGNPVTLTVETGLKYDNSKRNLKQSDVGLFYKSLLLKALVCEAVFYTVENMLNFYEDCATPK